VKLKEVSEWRGWIWIAVSLLVSLVGGGFTLYAKAEAYPDKCVEDVKSDVTDVKNDVSAQLSEIKGDMKVIQADIKLILRSK